MTAPMIEWTLEFLEWIRAQLFEHWPEAKLRGSAPDIHPDPYRIRFREGREEYWLILQPTTICNTAVGDVRDLLETEDWIPLMREEGTLLVGVQEPNLDQPVVHPC